MSKAMADINSVLESWASFSPPVLDFTVENVLFGIEYTTTYDFVLRFLLSKNGFEINVYRMFLCPDNHKAFQIKIDQVLDEDDDLPICHICGQDIINDLDHSFLIFEFTLDFIESCKKKVLIR